jgi:hypothetical protein
MLNLAFASLLALADPAAGAAQVPTTPPTPASAPGAAAPAKPSPDDLALSVQAGQGIRVGGDMDTQVTFKDGVFSIGQCFINTPLPEGYPAPTPPGAIDLKRYPVVRRAEFSSWAESDVGMNVGFFPLFNHIKRRDIEMTSPVEMDYGKLDAKPDERNVWTMAFLYRRVDQAPAGDDPADKRVKVVDTPEVLMISIGMRGAYGRNRVTAGVEQLREWLKANPGWEEAGEARALYYNGPERPNRHKWLEVQIPVRPATPRAGVPVEGTPK